MKEDLFCPFCKQRLIRPIYTNNLLVCEHHKIQYDEAANTCTILEDTEDNLAIKQGMQLYNSWRYKQPLATFSRRPIFEHPTTWGDDIVRIYTEDVKQIEKLLSKNYQLVQYKNATSLDFVRTAVSIVHTRQNLDKLYFPIDKIPVERFLYLHMMAYNVHCQNDVHKSLHAVMHRLAITPEMWFFYERIMNAIPSNHLNSIAMFSAFNHFAKKETSAYSHNLDAYCTRVNELKRQWLSNIKEGINIDSTKAFLEQLPNLHDKFFSSIRETYIENDPICYLQLADSCYKAHLNKCCVDLPDVSMDTLKHDLTGWTSHVTFNSIMNDIVLKDLRNQLLLFMEAYVGESTYYMDQLLREFWTKCANEYI